MQKNFTHLDGKDRPQMVDVGEKRITKRSATAQAIICLPQEIIKKFNGEEFHTKKGPVFQTAILAGIMAVKKTADLIPLCHPLSLTKCNVEINLNDKEEIVIKCMAKMHGRTGVEMEALTGVTVAALTIYDMCKGFSHDIVIKEIRLLAKSGGKRDFKLK